MNKIIADRAKGILVVTGVGSSPCLLEDLKLTLDYITLKEIQFGPEEQLFIAAKDIPMTALGQTWSTKGYLVDGSQCQPTGDKAFIRRVEAMPMRFMFEEKSDPTESVDVLSHSGIHQVGSYMRMGLLDRVAAGKKRAQAKSHTWWEHRESMTGNFQKDEFTARVMDHLADQYDGRIGSNPPTWRCPRVGDKVDENQPVARNLRRLSMGTAAHVNEQGISDEGMSDLDPQEAYSVVKSVVSIPRQAAEETNENPKVAKLKDRLIEIHARLFSGVANKGPPKRRKFGTAKIKLKLNPKIYGHREHQRPEERAEAIKKLLMKFIESGWIESSDCEWASPAFIVPKKAEGE